MKATISCIVGLAGLLERLSRQMQLANRAESTIACYSRVVRDLCTKVGKTPDQMDQDEIEDYLLGLKGRFSESTWHLHVCGIRYLFREVYGDELPLNLPTVKRSRTLPVVLTRRELGQLFEGCKSLKHRCMFRLAYGSGIRSNELRLLRIVDVDSRSMQLRIEQGKGRKDRFTVLPSSVLLDLRQYFRAARPKVYLFNGQQKGKPLSKAWLAGKLPDKGVQGQITTDLDFGRLRHSLYRRPWVIYAKQPFAGPQQVIEYLGRYTHRIAISNHRLQAVKDGKVRFAYKNYRKGGKQASMQLKATEFLRRFCMHILPARFVRIRHVGFLAPNQKGEALALIRKELGISKPECQNELDWK